MSLSFLSYVNHTKFRHGLNFLQKTFWFIVSFFSLLVFYVSAAFKKDICFNTIYIGFNSEDLA